ncbi:hypothetical protein [Streptacidiphilus sp. EB103A]|uniref:hypothetical protein n=1 Tax=Streptacidiphilus sp. EB103A TaxID=3156275 RepID=UPI003517B79E
MTDFEDTAPEIMPTLTPARETRRELWICHVRGDRQTDRLHFVADDGDHLPLSEAQARDLYAKLATHITAWDRDDTRH